MTTTTRTAATPSAPRPPPHRARTWLPSRATCWSTPSAWWPTPAASAPAQRTYYTKAKAVDFDYEQLLADDRAEIRRLVKDAQDGFARANPSYEEMEGVVAGVPSLAEYDVIIDAGSDGSDPENAVPFSIKTPAGRTFKQPGNFNYLIETTAFGTEPKFQAKGVEADLDGDGKVEFGESLPDADFYVAAARGLREVREGAGRRGARVEAHHQRRIDLARRHDPDHVRVLRRLEELALRSPARRPPRRPSWLRRGCRTSLTSSAAWCWSTTTWSRWWPRPTASRPSRPRRALASCTPSPPACCDKEEGGRKYTAEEADTLGSQAQERAEAIAGQITQAAAKLNIEIEEG